MRRLHGLVVSLAILLAGSAAYASEYPDYCDRSGDYVVTTLDSLIALQDAVDTCRTDYECDSNGDDESTTTDALLLLRDAVGLPADLECNCTYYDECFEDADCIEGYPPNYRCNYTLCVRCEQDTDCDEGEVCDPCSFDCIPDPAAE
jgi:hypothetical protein